MSGKYAIGVGQTSAGVQVPLLVDSDGKLVISGPIVYQGVWNANTNTPTLSDATGVKGHMYLVSVAGTQDLGSGSITYAIDDWVLHNGTIWQKSDHTDQVTSVNGNQGAIQLTDNLQGSISGNEFAITTGSKGWIDVGFNCTVVSIKAIGDTTGSFNVNIGSLTPEFTLASSGGYNQDTVTDEAGTTLSNGDILDIDVQSNGGGLKKVTLAIKVNRTDG